MLSCGICATCTFSTVLQPFHVVPLSKKVVDDTTGKQFKLPIHGATKLDTTLLHTRSIFSMQLSCNKVE